MCTNTKDYFSENNYYRKIVTYQDVFQSILARSVGNWTGFGEMPSSAAGEILWIIFLFVFLVTINTPKRYQ
jgi:hypothetical protein